MAEVQLGVRTSQLPGPQRSSRPKQPPLQSRSQDPAVQSMTLLVNVHELGALQSRWHAEPPQWISFSHPSWPQRMSQRNEILQSIGPLQFPKPH